MRPYREITREERGTRVARNNVPGRVGNRLSPDKLGLLGDRLSAASDPVEAARLKEGLTRGFYSIGLLASSARLRFTGRPILKPFRDGAQ